MGSSSRLNSRIFTNSFSHKEYEMARPLLPHTYFGMQNRAQYSYNTYHQLANNGAGFGALGARWARANNVQISFYPPPFR